MADEDGASPRELIIESCRRNNTSLLEETIADLASAASKSGKNPTEYVASTLNNARDAVGNGCLHVAATYGSYEILDILLDQEGLEIDEIDRMEKDTPLHKAVRYVNSLDKSDWASAGHHIVDILLDAGCDPRIRNKAKLKPVELVDPRNTELRSMLQKGEFAMQAGGDVVEDDDDGPTGSASDSD
ncbi:ankyrin repeat protein-like protein [Cucurbitaria berberidis CBS 394.84]|uniref:Ankyrin repeat protein-like protein n=1 Tax=Cucurbitaria berberidis CBS 394.84 TaxID=1168544 RepID=A0A9P4GD35_9PLEO|nr:ankyrin repeat protein-like protein [Cucurbitaria berberidis CBS 394.84]KAF1842995.1 ankyrin repeat protein-like protein [Cucurbitaria berberidis CBS 394.84]